jgi:hypothetical protein
MKTILIFFIVCQFLVCGYAYADELSELRDTYLVHLLNDFKTVAEIKDTKKLPFVTIRIIQLQDQGECNGKPETCPQEEFYIAVSTYDEYPDQKVYVLPKSHGWKFIGWKLLPKKEGMKQFIVFEVNKQVISNNPEKGLWSEEKYEVQVNPWKGFIQKIEK